MNAALAAVVLAAGEGRRIGGPKALLAWGGRSILAHQLHILAEAGVRHIGVVLGAAARPAALAARREAGGIWTLSGQDWIRRPDPLLRARAHLIWNAEWRSGKCGSIRAGAAASPLGADILLCTVDQPLTVDLVRALVRRPEGEWAAAVPVYKGKRGHPVRIAAWARPALLSLREEAAGLRGWLQSLPPGQVVEIPVDDPAARLNLNRWEDWERAAADGRSASEFQDLNE